MDTALVLTLTGYALLDALVTSTLFVVVVVLLTARRPIPTSIGYAVGALGSFFILTVALYMGASFMAELLETFTLWMRRVVLTAAAVFFTVMGVRRFTSRPRHQMKLPRWINPWTALPFGALMMLVDIPFSFPMFLAVERLAELGIGTGAATASLAAYTVVSSLPTVLIIALGILFGERARAFLQRLLDRFTTGYAEASLKIAAVHFALALGCLAVLTLVIG